jgi:hypothetical protein
MEEDLSNIEDSLLINMEVLSKITKRLYDISVISDKLYSDFNEILNANQHRNII